MDALIRERGRIYEAKNEFVGNMHEIFELKSQVIQLNNDSNSTNTTGKSEKVITHRIYVLFWSAGLLFLCLKIELDII